MGFEGKTAVVTGAAGGIGMEISRALSRRGTVVAVVDLELEKAREAAADISRSGAEARAYSCDVGSYDDAERTGQEILHDYGQVDFLVNNAGIVRDRLLIRMSSEDWKKVLEVNLTGTFNFTRVLAPQMLKRRTGRIVNISSVIALAGNPGQANYSASKAGIIGLTKSLAREFAQRGVMVNAVAPGFINTPMTESLSDEIRNKMLEAIPLGRFGEAEDVANIVVFLLSDSAAYVTGQVLNCDGGMVMAG